MLMVMVDDATNRLRARFSEEETTRGSYDVVEGWARRHRLPCSLYVDRDSIYRCEGVGERGRTTGRPSAADAVSTGDGAVRGGTDPGAQSAGQGAGASGGAAELG